MREIKFRAWDSVRKTMLTRGSVGFDGTCAHDHYDRYAASADGTDCWVELMQFTGLRDKNGKEIYEGDIIREFYEVEDDGATLVACDETFRVEWYCRDCDCGWNIEPVGTDCYEVIGNIYENPKLLGQ